MVTAYTLAFGSLLLLGGRLSDLLGRKVTFLTGLAGFAGVSAIGGVSVDFAMLITARACQGAFAALLVRTALSLLTTTFTEQKERGKAFGVFGAIAGTGRAVGIAVGTSQVEPSRHDRRFADPGGRATRCCTNAGVPSRGGRRASWLRPPGPGRLRTRRLRADQPGRRAGLTIHG